MIIYDLIANCLVGQPGEPGDYKVEIGIICCS